MTPYIPFNIIQHHTFIIHFSLSYSIFKIFHKPHLVTHSNYKRQRRAYCYPSPDDNACNIYDLIKYTANKANIIRHTYTNPENLKDKKITNSPISTHLKGNNAISLS